MHWLKHALQSSNGEGCPHRQRPIPPVVGHSQRIARLDPGCGQRLHPNAVDSLKRFDGKDLLMNSAMTKVYAAADPEQIIIYDGRVGAALGLLVRHWLTSRKQVQVPAELAFRWGPHATSTSSRNPSVGPLKFQSLYTASTQQSNSVEYWAKLVRDSNRLLRRVVQILQEQGVAVRLLDLERALFMIGYRVA